MEHPCHRCGTTIEEGTAFCPACSAPQIRVAPPENVASPPLPPGTPGQVQPPAQPVMLAPPGAPARVEWRHGFSAAMAAGILVAVVWAFPWAGFLFWGLVGGILAVLLYQRRHPVPVTPGMGARLGAVTGLLGFLAFAIIASLELLATRGALMHAMWAQVMQQAQANPNPAVHEMLGRLSSPEGMVVLFTFALLFVLAIFLVLSSVGGALGGWLFGRREK